VCLARPALSCICKKKCCHAGMHGLVSGYLEVCASGPSVTIRKEVLVLCKICICCRVPFLCVPHVFCQALLTMYSPWFASTCECRCTGIVEEARTSKALVCAVCSRHVAYHQRPGHSSARAQDVWVVQAQWSPRNRRQPRQPDRPPKLLGTVSAKGAHSVMPHRFCAHEFTMVRMWLVTSGS
jgi:hypothetical protein